MLKVDQVLVILAIVIVWRKRICHHYFIVKATWVDRSTFPKWLDSVSMLSDSLPRSQFLAVTIFEVRSCANNLRNVNWLLLYFTCWFWCILQGKVIAWGITFTPFKFYSLACVAVVIEDKVVIRLPIIISLHYKCFTLISIRKYFDFLFTLWFELPCDCCCIILMWCLWNHVFL